MLESIIFPDEMDEEEEGEEAPEMTQSEKELMAKCQSGLDAINWPAVYYVERQVKLKKEKQ